MTREKNCLSCTIQTRLKTFSFYSGSNSSCKAFPDVKSDTVTTLTAGSLMMMVLFFSFEGKQCQKYLTDRINWVPRLTMPPCRIKPRTFFVGQKFSHCQFFDWNLMCSSYSRSSETHEGKLMRRKMRQKNEWLDLTRWLNLRSSPCIVYRLVNWYVMDTQSYTTILVQFHDIFSFFAEEVKILNTKQPHFLPSKQTSATDDKLSKSELWGGQTDPHSRYRASPETYSLCQIESHHGCWNWSLSALCLPKISIFFYQTLLDGSFFWMQKFKNVNLERIVKSCESHRWHIIELIFILQMSVGVQYPRPLSRKVVFLRKIHFFKYPKVLPLIWNILCQ